MSRTVMNLPEVDDTILDKLFPAPSITPKSTSPYASHLGVVLTPESTATLVRLLKESHKSFHIFFNHLGFQNHLPYHMFAAYGLGASEQILQAIFDHHTSYQRQAYKSPQVITRDNWTKHLGDEDFYNAYLNFFTAEVNEHGLPNTFEDFILSHESNWSPDRPRMLDRFLAGLLHPMLHFGHGTEFGVDGMAVEGLAQTAVHQPAYEDLFDASYFSASDPDTRMPTTTINSQDSFVGPTPKKHTHALTILSCVLNDERLESGVTGSQDSRVKSKLANVLANVGNIIQDYASLWTVSDDEKDIEERLEELTWFVTIVFGLGGWNRDREFRPNFFLVHLLTSNLFIPSILSLLKPVHQAGLLKAYFAVALGNFVSHGRPAIDVYGFFESVSTLPKLNPTPSTCTSNEQMKSLWYALFSHTIRTQDEHFVKAQRALAYGEASYGARPKGYFSHTELQGAEIIDGTLFLRVGGLLPGSLRWWGRGNRGVPWVLPASIPLVLHQ